MTRRSFLAVAGTSLVACGARVHTASPTAPEADLVVETRAGRVRGERLGSVRRFLGLPYAQSLAGRNRFALESVPLAALRGSTTEHERM
ncbi:MAG: carboxylesterase family protein [Sandaracinus sp.]|nr:carboxylesterase family protein [Myxococcales bacterium]MCB9613818.1 carboxylesterase family protein [Sandaracinus sp.]